MAVKELRHLFLLLSLLLAAAVAALDDGDALLELRSAFGFGAAGGGGGVLPDWDRVTTPDFCSWSGVQCEGGRVVQLVLNGSSLSGELSGAVGRLQELKVLLLNDNRLSGQIPAEIGGCLRLQELDLSGNMFTGDIPYTVPQLRELETVVLGGNKLTGLIPATLAQLPNLKVLDLGENQLTGEIPSLLYWSNVLQFLRLRENNLTGELSPDMCRLTGLWYFDVRSNNISGPIPDTIGNCTSFQILDLSSNQLTGPIPEAIAWLQVSTLSLQRNRLTGPIPEFIGLMQALIVLDLSGNELEGTIPAVLGNLSFADKLYLHGNRLSGSIPPELGNITTLSYLQLNDNMLSGEIPSELGRLVELFQLILSNNQLSGPLPDNLSSCTALNYLDVHHNLLTGSVPPELERLDNLTFLNLSSNFFSGSIPEEVCNIINLDTLDFSNNNLTGPIPPLVGELEHLITLVLRGNRLSGTIPSSIGDLSQSLTLLDLSNNLLSGGLPAELGELQQLETLIVSNNKLTGPVPSQILNGYSLKYLDLSYNNLSGSINQSRFAPQSFLGNPFLCDTVYGPCRAAGAAPFDGRLGSSGIWGIAVAAACLLALLIFVSLRWFQPELFIKAWRKSVQGGSSAYSGPPVLVIFHMGMAIHSYEEIMRITDNLSDKFLIGRGSSSAVYKCVLKNGQSMAIKKLYSLNLESALEFKTELETVGNVKHRNLLSLRGYLLSATGNLLFFDYMENGSLWDVLHGEYKSGAAAPLDWNIRLKIAVGAAQGLAYLHHNCNPRIVHRDVKSSNILLDSNYEPRLSDFGIAKSVPMSKSFTSTYVIGTIGYIDPEYAQTSRLNEKSDVYSFGIVLLELLTGRKAVDDTSNLLQWVMSKVSHNTIVDVLDPHVVASCKDVSLPVRALKLALVCTKDSPSLRPNMYDVSQVLLSLLEMSQPKPDHVPPPAPSSPPLPPPVPAPAAAAAAPAPASALALSPHGPLQRRYLDDYVDSKHRKDILESNSSDNAHLLLQFGEVISQNST